MFVGSDRWESILHSLGARGLYFGFTAIVSLSPKAHCLRDLFSVFWEQKSSTSIQKGRSIMLMAVRRIKSDQLLRGLQTQPSYKRPEQTREVREEEDDGT